MTDYLVLENVEKSFPSFKLEILTFLYPKAISWDLLVPTEQERQQQYNSFSTCLKRMQGKFWFSTRIILKTKKLLSKMLVLCLTVSSIWIVGQ